MTNYYNESTIVFYDDAFVKAADAKTDLYSQTLHYGAGVFEGIRAYDTPNGTKIFKAVEHYQRLLYSAEKMLIKHNYSVEQLIDITYEVLKRNNLTNAYIRPLMFLGPNMSLSFNPEVHFMLCVWKWDKYMGNNLLNLNVSSYQRPNPNSCHVDAKITGHYVNSILATVEAKSKGFDEALLLDGNGNVAEGAGANFFLEKDNTLYTPAKGNILPGITRSVIIQLAEKNNIPVMEKDFTTEFVKQADSAFFVGTAAEITGIGTVNEYEFPKKWENTLGHFLSKKYSEYTLS